MKEIKDLILETLSQIEEGEVDLQTEVKPSQREDFVLDETNQDREILSASLIDEREFLLAKREKLLVLFEGLLSPQTQNLETKYELVVRYLQFLLSEIDKRLKEI